MPHISFGALMLLLQQQNHLRNNNNNNALAEWTGWSLIWDLTVIKLLAISYTDRSVKDDGTETETTLPGRQRNILLHILSTLLSQCH